MVRQQQVQPVTAITTTPAGVHIGMQVFAVVGTDEHGGLGVLARSRQAHLDELMIVAVKRDGIWLACYARVVAARPLSRCWRRQMNAFFVLFLPLG